MPDRDLAQRRWNRASDPPLPNHAPSPKDDKTRPSQPPAREAEHLSPEFRSRLGRGTVPQRKERVVQDDPTIENAMASLNSSEGSMATLRFLPRVDAELPYARQSRASGGETTMNPPPNRRRMSPEELQSAADHIRMGNGDYNPDQYGTLTVTEGVQNGRPVYTVTSSRGKLKDREMGRAAEIFGWHGFVTPLNDIRRIARSQTDWHAEQRGIRATAHQDERRQASSNVTPDTRAHPTVLHVGAACPGCAAAQRNAGVTNVTGTVEGGGRFNNPQNPLAWKRWRDG